jgi:Fe-Mn family superoxide dismutase
MGQHGPRDADSRGASALSGARYVRAQTTFRSRHSLGAMNHTLPPLPYDVAALEPHIGARTMALHHDRHHAGYVEKLNAALEPFPELHDRSASWLLLNLDKLPVKARVAVRNNAGGHENHSLLWKAMTPRGAGAPAGDLADAIDRDFGGFAQLKARFAEAASEVLGSGRAATTIRWRKSTSRSS